MKKVLVICSSLRTNSNSDYLAKKISEGINKETNEVEIISLKGKVIEYCVGCLSCQKFNRECFLKDDANPIIEKIKEADKILFVSPIYYYNIPGQLKTLLDRTNPLFLSDYKFRDIYFASVAAEEESTTPIKAIESIKGWVDCFEKAKFKESFFVGGVTEPKEILKVLNDNQALNFGRKI